MGDHQNLIRTPERKLWLSVALVAGLVVALGCLVVAFAVSFNLAARQYQRLAMSERQATAVIRIAELAEMNAGSEIVTRMLAHYRSLVIHEIALLPNSGKYAEHQREEYIELARLENLARASNDASAFRTVSAQIASQEAREVATARVTLRRIHILTIALAVALTITALFCVISVVHLLIQRNNSLEIIVQDRTAQLKEIDRSRRLFFAKVSHELRTPVTALRGEAETALLNPSPPVQKLRQSLSYIRGSAAFLGHRIDELLGLASADDGKLQLTYNSLKFDDVISDAIREAMPFAQAVDVEIVRTGRDGHARVRGDARWLRQALLGLIDNGLKFSPMNGVLTVDFVVRAHKAEIAVMDNGPGLIVADLPHIFEAYYQAEMGRQRGGSGLGLALARWITEQHGGTIRAANRPQGGSSITIALPLEKTA